MSGHNDNNETGKGIGYAFLLHIGLLIVWIILLNLSSIPNLLINFGIFQIHILIPMIYFWIKGRKTLARGFLIGYLITYGIALLLLSACYGIMNFGF